MNLSWLQRLPEIVNKLSWTRSLYNAVGFSDGGVIRGSDASGHPKRILAVIEYNQDAASIEGWCKAEKSADFSRSN
jgi:hypothetical protein